MPGVRSAILGLSALLLGACSAVDVLNATAETDGIEIATDVAYADGPRHTLDIYAPKNARGAPVAIFIYGGGWESGSKEMYRFVGAALAARGIVTIIPDYRVYPEILFPDFLTDTAQAVRWAKDNAAKYGADPARLVLAGHSAGAHIAAMLALDSQWLRGAGVDPFGGIAGFVGLAGPYDFLPLESETLKTIFGPEDQRGRTQPINFVDANAPPSLLIVGGLDRTVLPRNSENLADKITSVGGEVKIIRHDWIGHVLVIGAFARPLRVFAPVLDETATFITGVTPRGFTVQSKIAQGQNRSANQPDAK